MFNWTCFVNFVAQADTSSCPTRRRSTCFAGRPVGLSNTKTCLGVESRQHVFLVDRATRLLVGKLETWLGKRTVTCNLVGQVDRPFFSTVIQVYMYKKTGLPVQPEESATCSRGGCFVVFSRITPCPPVEQEGTPSC